MSERQPPGPEHEARIGKQIMLPWSKAVEIAAKSIQVRFWRSMITMSSIILAIAFLMSIWTSTAIVASLSVGPGRDLEAVKTKLKRVRQAPTKAAADRQALLDEFPGELADAVAALEDTIADKEDEAEEAVGAERKKLQEEIAALKAKLAPAKRVDLLIEHLTTERSRLQRRKGQLDTILQQERVAGEQAAQAQGDDKKAEAAAPVQLAGGLLTDFLLQMSPTDKWLAILALLVCFVGIVNAMFMTVQERFREIGTMKCLGALDAFIVKLFLIESAALGFIGTLMGIVIGLILSSLRQLVVYGGPVVSYFPKGSIFMAAVMAALIGLILSILAAIFPARKAARMEPVEAMRIEE